ncbi:hypothetical protein, partial [Nocardia wallacei]|uniref:hypothetical protein n=1 Tax=Nocardia wallacei TaxID=480035 RepID=UPI002454E93C
MAVRDLPRAVRDSISSAPDRSTSRGAVRGRREDVSGSSLCRRVAAERSPEAPGSRISARAVRDSGVSRPACDAPGSPGAR